MIKAVCWNAGNAPYAWDKQQATCGEANRVCYHANSFYFPFKEPVPSDRRPAATAYQPTTQQPHPLTRPTHPAGIHAPSCVCPEAIDVLRASRRLLRFCPRCYQGVTLCPKPSATVLKALCWQHKDTARGWLDEVRACGTVNKDCYDKSATFADFAKCYQSTDHCPSYAAPPHLHPTPMPSLAAPGPPTRPSAHPPAGERSTGGPQCTLALKSPAREGTSPPVRPPIRPKGCEG